MTSPERRWLLAAAVGLAAPVAVAVALTPVRSQLDNRNVALVLVVVVVATATTGRRGPTALAALSAALSFDFFHTLPYHSFRIRQRDDAITEALLLVVGLVVGELAARGREQRLAARERSGEIAGIHAVAELVSSGEPAQFVVISAANQLCDLLSLQDCRFDREPATKPIPRIEPSGDVMFGELRWGAHSMGLPGREVELAVHGQGRWLGRYVLRPTPGHPVSFERRMAAVALADQVGAALAAASAPA